MLGYRRAAWPFLGCLPLIGISFVLAGTQKEPAPYAADADRFHRTFLDAVELPGYRLIHDQRMPKADPKKMRFVTRIGEFYGERVWERKDLIGQAVDAAASVGLMDFRAGRGPTFVTAALAAGIRQLSPRNMVYDLRWVFRDSRTAKEFVKTKLDVLSESKAFGMTRIENAPDIGDESYLFGRAAITQGHQRATHQGYNYVFRVGNVVVKLFRMQPISDHPSALKMGTLAHRIARRIRATKPSGEPGS
jgi:hypothetical protein